MNTNRNHILWFFTYRCMNENVVFTDVDFYNFSKACNLKVDEGFARKNFFFNNELKTTPHTTKTFIATKSLFGPCYIHSTDINPKNVKYNLSKIIDDLKLSKQNLTPMEKLQKVLDYVKLSS